MGINMPSIRIMEGYGLFGAGRSILDLGSSNLYEAPALEIIEFVKRHNPAPRKDLLVWANRLSAGSYGGMNDAFVGEMLEAAGMTYDAIDIADGYKTTIVDLNSMRLPEAMVGKYDTVLNCGTSEHILNQLNTFGAIHAATKHGGFILHSVPSIGYVDHGYFCYTSRFFLDLAGFNQYDVIDMWFDGAAGKEKMYSSARQYQSYFPNLTSRLDKIGKSDRETMLDAMDIPTISITLIYRKAHDVPFMGMVETSTSVGDIPGSVTGAYQHKP